MTWAFLKRWLGEDPPSLCRSEYAENARVYQEFLEPQSPTVRKGQKAQGSHTSSKDGVNGMKSTDFLQAAIDVQNQRAADYDSPGGERSMGQTVRAFNAITGRDLTEAEGWLLLQVLKDVRQWSASGYHHDSALDGVAYSALKAEALAAGQVTDVPQAKPVPEVNRTGNPQLWLPGDAIRFIGESGHLFLTGDVKEVKEVRGSQLLIETGTDIEHTLSFKFAAENFEWLERA